MTTILRSGALRFFLYGSEDREPPHIRVEGGDATAKYWLDESSSCAHADFKHGIWRDSASLLSSMALNSWRLGMPILANRLSAQAMSVEFVCASIRVVLADGREISAPIKWFPRLRDAFNEQCGNWKLIGRGEASIGRRSMRTYRSTLCWGCLLRELR